MAKIPDRTYGVELEIAGLSQEQAFLVLRMAGLPVEDPCNRRGNGDRMSKWRFHEDGSIEDTRGDIKRTVEVVSPILTGAAGFKQIRKACSALAAAGGYVNKSCGLHVHVGARDLTIPEVLSLCRRYAKHEEFVDSIVHPSRRADSNRYCYSVQRTLNELDWNRTVENIRRDLRSYDDWLARHMPLIEEAEAVRERPVTVGDVAAHFSGQAPIPAPLPRDVSCYECQRGRTRFAIRDALGYYCGTMRCNECRYNLSNLRREAESIKQSKAQLEAKIARGTWESVAEMTGYVGDRYRAVNLQAFDRHGTIEFRQHHGTIDGAKVTAWVRFVLEFVENSRKLAPEKTKIQDRGPMMGLPKRLREHFEARRNIRGNRYDAWA